MQVTIVGGNYGFSKESSIVNKIYDELKVRLGNIDNHFTDKNITKYNGGLIEELPKYLDNSDLSIWIPNIDNEEKKHYPLKKQGSVLIRSKVMRDGYTKADAVSRIFKMHANAVIAISKDPKTSLYNFTLIDALGNEWSYGFNIANLCENILEFYKWSSTAIRQNTIKDSSIEKPEHPNLQELIDINNKLASYIQTSCGERFFGNISTRCQKLFPTANFELGIYVSPRNSDKEKLEPDDMIYINHNLKYNGKTKPSVDAPVQLMLYTICPDIQYMIHGHAFIEDASTTSEYYPCGDLREVREILGEIDINDFISYNGYINLKNHGFLIYASNIKNLDSLVNELITNHKFTYERGNNNMID